MYRKDSKKTRPQASQEITGAAAIGLNQVTAGEYYIETYRGKDAKHRVSTG